MQKYSGFNLNLEGWLCDRVVRTWFRPSDSHYDAMHIWWSNGIFGQEAAYFLTELDEAPKTGELNVGSTELIALAGATWTTPDSPCARHSNPHQRTRAARMARRDKCSASELILFFPLLEYFVRELVVPSGKMIKLVDSLLALCASVRQVQMLKFSYSDEGCSNLLTLIQKHLDLFIDAYGHEYVRPKHHCQFHVPAQAKKRHMLLDCFAPERTNANFQKCSCTIFGTTLRL